MSDAEAAPASNRRRPPLDPLLRPTSVAVVGAVGRPGSVAAVIRRNLEEAGFAGRIDCVDRKGSAGPGRWMRIADLPQAPDLGIVVTNADGAPGAVEELADRGCRAAIVIASPTPAERTDLHARLREIAVRHGVRLLGPNTLGLIVPGIGLNASFAHLTPRAGDLALVSQSGAIAVAAADWAHAAGFGFSHIAALGDAIDVDAPELIDALAADPEVRAILLYLESIGNARRFMSAARAAARIKPVIVLKAGRSATGSAAALTHTGALAGSDLVADAAFRRAGLVRVDTLPELFEAAEVLSRLRVGPDDALMILTNAGGAGVLAADALEERGLPLARLPAELAQALAAVLPAAWSGANPIDMLGDSGPERYAAALEAVIDAHDGPIVVMNCPTGVADRVEIARRVAERAAHAGHRVMAVWLGQTEGEAQRLLSAAGLAVFNDPAAAVRAYAHAREHVRRRVFLAQTPTAPAPHPDRVSAQAAARAARDAGLVQLQPEALGALLAAYGVPAPASVFAADAPEALAAAEAIGYPVALKVVSPQVSHKSDVGGVALGLADAAALRAAAARLAANLAAADPQAVLSGFEVQAMANRPHGRELLVGIARDPAFGPVVLFGEGGSEAELAADRAIGLPPLNLLLARDLVSRTRIARRLGAWRKRPAADLDALCRVLVSLSEMAIDLPDLAEFEINPLVLDEDGALALDPRGRLDLSASGEGVAPAIRPYPHALEGEERLASGATVRVRPIRPEDEPALVDFVGRASPEDVRARFFASVHALPHSLAARLCQIDYDRDMAFVAFEGGRLVAVARLAFSPCGAEAEYALMLSSDRHWPDLADALLGRLLDYARGRGAVRVFGDELRDSAFLIAAARRAGARAEASPMGATVERLVFDLEAWRARPRAA